MSDLKLDNSTWDLVIENGDLVLMDEQESIGQLVRQRLGWFLGEWFLDASGGVPYFEDIFVKGVSLAVVDSLLKFTILETPGVLELLSFILDYDGATRTLSLTFEARTSDGIINFNEELGIL